MSLVLVLFVSIAICQVDGIRRFRRYGEEESLGKVMSRAGTDKFSQHGYHRFYEKEFERFRYDPVRILEIGVQGGESLIMWRDYFKNAELIVGVGYGNYKDQYFGDNVRIIYGDQSSADDLDRIMRETGGRFDIILDDGSHNPWHQMFTFSHLLSPDALNDEGIYIIEDTETSYWNAQGAELFGYKFHAGFKSECSVIETTKKLIDVINREFVGDVTMSLMKWDHRIRSITYSQNTIIFHVISDEDAPYTNRNYRLNRFVIPPRGTVFDETPLLNNYQKCVGSE